MFDRIINPVIKTANEDKTDSILVLLKVVDSSCTKDTKDEADKKIKQLIKDIN